MIDSVTASFYHRLSNGYSPILFHTSSALLRILFRSSKILLWLFLRSASCFWISTVAFSVKWQNAMLAIKTKSSFKNYHPCKDHFLIVTMLKKDTVISFSRMISKKAGNAGLILQNSIWQKAELETLGSEADKLWRAWKLTAIWTNLKMRDLRFSCKGQDLGGLKSFKIF